jgi:ABC-type histidine transport system ATPase subunit
MPFLDIENLEKRFGNVEVLKGINLAKAVFFDPGTEQRIA